MSRLVQRAGWRFFLRHPWQLALAISGVALGVAVVTGVDLAGGAALRAFDLSREAVVGRATHQLLAPNGRFRESVYLDLRIGGTAPASAPVVEGRVRASDTGPLMLTMMGVDPLAEGPFRDYAAARGSVDLAPLMTEPGAVLGTRELAARLGIEMGDRFSVHADGRDTPLRLVGWLEPEPERRAVLEEFLLADIATAQEVLGMLGQLSRVDLVLSEAEAGMLSRTLPDEIELSATTAQSRSMSEMTRAFRINLLALSLLALLVGAFLIYSTMSFLVVQRRTVIGTLRTLGVSRAQLFTSVLRESLLVGTPGTVIGLMLGWLLGAGLTRLVVRTIDDLYFQLEFAGMHLDAAALLKGVVLGIGVTVVASLAPAAEAAAVPPRSVLSRASFERRARRRLPWLLLGAALALVAGVGLIRLGPPTLAIGFLGLLCVILAAAFAAPPAIVAMTSLIGRLAGRRLDMPSRMALRGISSTLSRTGVAVAALMVAVASVIGVGVMVGSFRISVDNWLRHSLRADLYISLEEAWYTAGRDPEALASRLSADPGIAEVTRSVRHRLETGDEQIRLWALDPGSGDWGFDLLQGEETAARAAFLSGDAVWLSEPFARHRQLGVGDELELATRDGRRRFRVAAVFRDYTSDRGVVAIHLPAFRAGWGIQRLGGLGLIAAPGAGTEQLRKAVDQALGDAAGVQVASNAEIRQVSLAIFDRTFTITRVLQVLVGIVAFLGILSALQSLQMERVRELAVLRALGWTPGQVRRLIMTQTGLLGAAAGILAAPLGLVLALFLVQVINMRAFGWSMGFHPDVATLGQGLLLAVAAALFGGLYPAWRSGQRRPARDLRDE
jgi:putative ABC transport system permease protein